MIETMPDDLFKFLEANPENWGLHERLDPCLDFNELGWDSMFGWNLNLYLILDFFVDFYYDLYLISNISPTQAILGTEIKVPTLKEDIKIKIPPGTQPRTIFRIKNKGIQYLNSYNKGDLYVKVDIKIPNKLSQKEKKLYQELANINKEKINFKKGFFDKIFGGE